MIPRTRENASPPINVRDLVLGVVSLFCIKQAFFSNPSDAPTPKYTPVVKVTTTEVTERFPSCTKNPYLSAMEPLSDITKKMDAWFNDIDRLGTKAMESKMYKHTPDRFFPFDELAACEEKTCVGGDCTSDRSKYMCGVSELKKQKHCVVYSIGSDNMWEFELDILDKTPCEVHTFDCTGDRARFKVPDNPRLHFHYVCLTAYPPDPNQKEEGGERWTMKKIQQELGHSRIDLLKVDIEGWEFPMLSSWPELAYKEESESLLLPMQILVELHYTVVVPMLHPDRGDWKNALELLEFQQHLMRMGYVVAVRNDQRVKHCTELTLVRARCPNSGVYAQI